MSKKERKRQALHLVLVRLICSAVAVVRGMPIGMLHVGSGFVGCKEVCLPCWNVLGCGVHWTSILTLRVQPAFLYTDTAAEMSHLSFTTHHCCHFVMRAWLVTDSQIREVPPFWRMWHPAKLRVMHQ